MTFLCWFPYPSIFQQSLETYSQAPWLCACASSICTLDCATRELTEETGYEADVMLSLGEVWPSVGYLTERIYLYYAPSTHFVGQKLDPQEFLNVKTYSYDQLMTMAHHNLINDGKTLALLLRMKPHLKD